MSKTQEKISPLKFIISGGGTGGHIFPAIAIANALKKQHPEAEFLFVGAEGKMEMEKVPQAGYEIMGLPIRGIQRKLSLRNLSVPFRLFISLIKAYSIIRKFRPDAVIGVGGYASAAVLYVASFKKIKSYIQEQNSFPGMTNKMLANRVHKIFVAFENMDKYFPKEKILLKGNPVRREIIEASKNAGEARKQFQLDPERLTILAVGGSLGAKTINESVLNCFPLLEKHNVQLLWQTGKHGYQKYAQRVPDQNHRVRVQPFISNMADAYAAADIIISRAGAISVTEIAVLNKPAILIPSPNVAEDHQTKNAKALSEHEAALLIPDKVAREELPIQLEKLVQNKEQLAHLKDNLKLVFSNAKADLDIAETIIKDVSA